MYALHIHHGHVSPSQLLRFLLKDPQGGNFSGIRFYISVNNGLSSKFYISFITET